MPALGPPGALSPQQWGARINYDEWRDFYTPDDGIALHHGGGFDYLAGRAPYDQAKEIAKLQDWERYHLSKGWRGLAYGWAVGQTGTIYRIRGWASYGAHTGDVDGDGIANNSEIIPILFIGSGHHHHLSPEAEEAIETLRAFIEAQAPDAQYLYGHQELKGTATSCPGPNLMEYVTTHRYYEDMPTAKEVAHAVWYDEPLEDYITGENLHPSTHLRHARADAYRARVDAAVARALAEKAAREGLLSDADIAQLAQEISDKLEAELAAEVAVEIGQKLVA